MEPEELADIMQRLEQEVSKAIGAYGGTLVQMQGDGVLAVFGYPQSDENAPRHAIEAALEAHAAFRRTAGGAADQDDGLRLHSGIHSGMFVARPGGEIDGRYVFFGDTVNVASHLCDAAGRDEVVVSDATINGVLPFFATEAGRFVSVKGVSEPLLAYRVMARKPYQTRFAARENAGLTRFVGREAQLAALRRTLAHSTEGVLRAVALVGEAGIGKTRLAKEFVAAARDEGHVCGEGYCESFGSCGPLQPVRHIIADIVGLPPEGGAIADLDTVRRGLTAIDPELAAFAEDVGRIIDFVHGRSDESIHMDEVVDVLCALCLRISRDRTLILSVDDWQWADDSSRHLLGKIATSGRSGSILLLVTSRDTPPEDVVLASADHINLGPLSLEDARRAIQDLTSLPSSDDLLERIVAQAGGNPLYLEEVAHLLAGGAVDILIADGVLGPSATVQELIKSRLEMLDEADSDLLQAAAVIGNVIDLRLLEAVACGLDKAALLRLRDGGLLMSGASPGSLRFKHGMSRDVVYASIALDTRRRLHAAILKSLNEIRPGESGAELLAYHHAGAGDHAAALDFAEAAADRALSASALDRTRLQFEACARAIEHLGAEPERDRRFLGICNRCAEACVFGPSREHAEILARAVRCADELGEPALNAQLNRWAGYCEYVLGDQARAIDYFERALDKASFVKRPSFSIEIRANLGQAYAAACAYEPALAYLNEVANAEVQIELRSGRPPVAVAFALSARALVFADRGEFERAALEMDAALTKYGGAGQVVEASIRNMRATAELWRGRSESGLVEAEAALEIAGRAGATYVLGCSIGLRGRALCLADRWTEGVANLREAVSMFERRGLRLFSSIYQAWLAEGCYRIGERDEATAHARRALGRGDQRDLFGTPMAHRVLAAIAAEDDPASANVSRHLALARKAARHRSSPQEEAATDMMEGALLARIGRDKDAAAMVGRATAAFEALDMTSEAEAARALIPAI